MRASDVPGYMRHEVPMLSHLQGLQMALASFPNVVRIHSSCEIICRGLWRFCLGTGQDPSLEDGLPCEGLRTCSCILSRFVSMAAAWKVTYEH